MVDGRDGRSTTKGKTWAGLLASVLILVVMLAAVAEAGRGKGGSITSCVSKRTGVVRIVQDTTKCGHGEYRLKWNLRGRPGPQGPTGPAAGGGAER